MLTGSAYRNGDVYTVGSQVCQPCFVRELVVYSNMGTKEGVDVIDDPIHLVEVAVTKS